MKYSTILLYLPLVFVLLYLKIIKTIFRRLMGLFEFGN